MLLSRQWTICCLLSLLGMMASHWRSRSGPSTVCDAFRFTPTTIASLRSNRMRTFSHNSHLHLDQFNHHVVYQPLHHNQQQLQRERGAAGTLATAVCRALSPCLAVLSTASSAPRSVFASAMSLPTTVSAAPTSPSPWTTLGLWAALFIFSSTMHSAEAALTKISRWKVQEYAEDEGPHSPFARLTDPQYVSHVLTAILLATTACSIYSTALFVSAMTGFFPALSLGVVSATLTAITLFFGELLPKAVAVAEAELVVRRLSPILAKLSLVLQPVTVAITFLSDAVLRRVLGHHRCRSRREDEVSEDMLRMVVAEAAKNEHIESGESRMIHNVLDMEDKVRLILLSLLLCCKTSPSCFMYVCVGVCCGVCCGVVRLVGCRECRKCRRS
jgi:general stress protein CsbA